MRADSPVGRLVLWTLIAVIGMPPVPATAADRAGNWLRVASLKPETRILVTLDNKETVEGWLVSAGARGLVVRLIPDEVAIPRERVMQVAIVKAGRPWYATPVIAAAVIGGVAITVGMLWAIGGGYVSLGDLDDGDWGILAVFSLPVLAGVWAYRQVEGDKVSLKVIYKAPLPVRRPADR